MLDPMDNTLRGVREERAAATEMFLNQLLLEALFEITKSRESREE